MRTVERISDRADGPAAVSWVSFQLRDVVLTILLLAVSTYHCLAQPVTPAYSGAHVYLLRGALDIFSLGMDEIAAKLAPLGIETTVTNYLDSPVLAEQAAADYKSGRLNTIVLVGHSSGAVAVTEMAARLNQLGVPVKLAIGLDPTSRLAAPANVEVYLNYYVAHGMGTVVDQGSQFRGTLQNIAVDNDRGLDHFNIDKDQALQQRVIGDILASVTSPPAVATKLDASKRKKK